MKLLVYIENHGLYREHISYLIEFLCFYDPLVKEWFI